MSKLRRRVETTAYMGVVMPDSSMASVRATLRYNPNDPFTVHLCLHLDYEDILWPLAYTLLKAGIKKEARSGGVKIWPCGSGYIALALPYSDGYRMLEVHHGVLDDFLKDVYQVVTGEDESGRFASVVDEAIARLSPPIEE